MAERFDRGLAAVKAWHGLAWRGLAWRGRVLSSPAMLCCLGPPPQLDDGGFIVVEAGGRSLLLRREERRFVAMELRCAHQGARLGEEHIGPDLIATCPRHGWQYDLRTGRCKTRPEYLPMPSYEVHLQGGELWVDLPTPRDEA